MTTEEAISLGETCWWEGKTAVEIAGFQLFEDKLCCPFGVFHKSVEEALGRPVFTHEFASSERLQEEFLKLRPQATREEIFELIPEEKRVIVKLEEFDDGTN